MMTLNAAHLSASKPSSSVARIKWPVEETGRTSVTPSTMPRMIAISRIGTSVGRGQVDPPPGELAAAMEAAEPFVADRRERRWIDPERLEPWKVARWHIVALQHQPLVAGQRRSGQPAELREQAPGDVGKRQEVRLLTRQLKDRAVKVDHAHRLRPPDLVGLPAEAIRPESSHRDRLAEVTDVDRLKVALAGDHRKEGQPGHAGEAVGELVFGAEHQRGADDGGIGEGLADRELAFALGLAVERRGVNVGADRGDLH